MQRKQFDQTFEHGISRSNDCFRVLMLSADSFELGMVVSSKLGNAVTRNRLRRLIRAAIVEKGFNDQYVVVIAKGSSIALEKQADVSASIHSLVERILRAQQ